MLLLQDTITPWTVGNQTPWLGWDTSLEAIMVVTNKEKLEQTGANTLQFLISDVNLMIFQSMK